MKGKGKSAALAAAKEISREVAAAAVLSGLSGLFFFFFPFFV